MFGNPCWELGFVDGVDEEDEDAAWVCEGKMDMKFLEGRVWGSSLLLSFFTLPKLM